MAKVSKYNIQDFTNITFNGFDITLPESTLAIISELSLHVGSPTYIRTPIFAKRDNIYKGTLSASGSASVSSYESASGSGSGSSGYQQELFKKRKGRRGGAVEIINDEDWETIRTFQTTKIEQKVGIDAQIDLIRSSLNKMSDNNYNDQCNNIFSILDSILNESSSQDEMLRVGNAIFEIASNNRFYSKLYADLFSKLIEKYEIMRTIFEKNLSTFLELFNCIESGNPDEDYNLFCKINKDNERRKSLSAFFVNLMSNKIIGEEQILDLIKQLIKQVYEFVRLDNKKNEVDEIVENLSILYNKKLVEECEDRIYDNKLIELIQMFASCKPKAFPSLTSKTIFKFMDILEI
uniref:MIF4G domain-containing protein n=1 Tax=viral metagenome TaxID=1070528 RepID=A0A6C0KYB7_9ZZZZ